jgi:hypothetical protein
LIWKIEFPFQEKKIKVILPLTPHRQTGSV